VAMNRYVVFLRGINVGGRIVKMADLKVCLEKLGLDNVKTYLQSGNVSFESSEISTEKLKKQIEEELTDNFSYPAKVQVLGQDRLEGIIDKSPFHGDGSEKHQYVIFMENGLEAQLASEAFDTKQEEIAKGDGVVYWKVDKGSTLKSSFAKHLTKAKYKDFNTNRNINTLRKML
jgi:uncharacterized protein (DUF1697 family)